MKAKPWVVLILDPDTLAVNVFGYWDEDEARNDVQELLGCPVDEADEEGDWLVHHGTHVMYLKLEFSVQ